MTIHVLQGERERAQDNKSLGKFDLTDIPPAPRGMPQVEVAFDIDANGILNVSAKDKATGKEQRIVIRASSGLNEDEIKRMVKDAEAHAAEDRKFRELVETRNRADALVHQVEKALKDLGDKVSPEERAKAESALGDLRAVLKSDDKEPSRRRPRRWRRPPPRSRSVPMQPIRRREGRRALRPRVPARAIRGCRRRCVRWGRSKAEENVVDAEFEEVRDKGRRAS